MSEQVRVGWALYQLTYKTQRSRKMTWVIWGFDIKKKELVFKYDKSYSIGQYEWELGQKQVKTVPVYATKPEGE